VRLSIALLASCLAACPPAPLETHTDDSVAVEEPSPITWEECSAALGDHACDFTFEDQAGNEWSLYDQYGSIIVLDFSVMWCGPCQSAASQVAAHVSKYANDDVVWVTVLLQDSTGASVSLEDVQNWQSLYGIPDESPILQGDNSIVDSTGQTGYPVMSYPTLVVIDREMVMYQGLHGWSQEVIEGWIDELLLLDAEAESE
tara:strand:+ start:244 stop:846 length:603 start_codon:yes stop_codon:yes gene_type:complete